MASHILQQTPSYIQEPECMPKCHSPAHASTVMNIITRGTEEEVMAYLQWLCSNHCQLIDTHGRSALHMAASCGKWQVLHWLLSKRATDCNTRDWESGWTPLHRSVYYGQLTAAQILLDHGANLLTLDHDRLSPLDLVMKDRPKFMEYSTSGLYEAYVWGINHNYNLGLGIQQSKPFPELMDTFRKENISITQIVMCKFHTMFLSQGGQVFACGHGHGGRLGLSVECTVLTPQPLKAVSKEICIQIACGTDHNVLLMENGSVWTCGSNIHHQLGHVPAIDKVLTPRPITSNKLFKNETVLGVCAGKYHSVVHTQDAIITFGLNAGQLGHPAVGDKLQTAPRIVSALSNQNMVFTHVTASDGATICITKKGDIYALHEYQCRKIASKRYDVKKVLASGGCLNPKTGVAALKEGGGTELRVVFLNKIGEIYVWSESHPQVTRCLLLLGRHLCVVDIALFNEGLLLVTNDGEGFIGNFAPPKVQTRKSEESAGRQLTSYLAKHMVTSFLTFLEKDECVHLKVKRLVNVHRATAVACDNKGRNFAVLQAHPKSSLLEVPQLSPSEMALNMRTFMQESDPYDTIHDVIVKLGQHQFACHKYILALHSEWFRSQILKKNFTCGEKDDCIILTDFNVHPSVLQQIFEFLYTNDCKLLTGGQTFTLSDPHGHTVNNKCNSKFTAHQQPDLILSIRRNTSDSKKKSCKKEQASAKKSNLNPVKLMAVAAKKLGISSLEERLSDSQFLDGIVNVTSQINCSSNKLKFDRMQLSELYDIRIKCEDGKEIMCHKCVLVARSEYFHGMLASNWIETKKLSSLTMPIPSAIMEIVIDCLYTDDVPKLMISEDLEFVCNTLAVADCLLISRLKEFCEIKLTELLTLKNSTELLEFSWVYNAHQLKATCMQFIGLNLSALLEAKSLSVLSSKALVELTKNYRQLIRQMSYRAITPYSDGPSLEDIQVIAQMFPVSIGEGGDDENECLSIKGNHAREEKKSKTKRKPPVQSTSWVSEDATESCSRNESTCSMGSEIMPISDLAELTKGLVIKPKAELKEFNQQNMPESALQSPPPQYARSPNGTSKWLAGNEDMNSAFPDLLNELKQQTPSGGEEQHKANSEGFKKTSKLSQKQRKKLATTPASAPVPIPHELFAKKCGNPWMATASENSNLIPLKDIMAMEKESVCPKLSTNTFSRSVKMSSPMTQQNNVSASVKSPKQFENVWNGRPAIISPPDGQAEKHSPCNAPPNGKPRSKDFTPCFSDILRSEQEEFRNLSKMTTKPLPLIQLEDQAIDELIQFYNAHNNPDEHITVKRMSPQYAATPIWKPSKSLGM